MGKKEDIKYLEDNIDRVDRKFDKLNKTVKILLEYLEDHAEEKDKDALKILKKTLHYWG